MLYKTLPLLVLAVASQIGEASQTEKRKILFGKEGGSHGPVKREPLFGMPLFGKPPEPIVDDTVSPTVAPTVAPTEEEGYEIDYEMYASPTVATTESPTVAPTESPTESPTVAPAESPTESLRVCRRDWFWDTSLIDQTDGSTREGEYRGEECMKVDAHGNCTEQMATATANDASYELFEAQTEDGEFYRLTSDLTDLCNVADYCECAGRRCGEGGPCHDHHRCYEGIPC